MYKVIIAPTEGSDSERSAISVAVKLAQRFDADLRLVRVETTPLMIDAEFSQSALRRARLRKMEALGTQCRTVGGIRVITALEEGPVAPTLRDYIKKFKVDLIVMSSHSRGGVRRITLGSVTDYLIRHTNIPVLVVKPPVSFIGATPEETFSRIALPLDGSGLAEQILPEVAALATRLNSTVSLFQILPPLSYSQKKITQSGLPWWDTVGIAVAYLARAAKYLIEEGLTVTKEVVLSDDVANGILHYSMLRRADLIAIATGGSGGLRRFVFGTVADKVTRKSPVSVLVFHPKRFGTTASAGERSSADALAGV
jgi:nucleotide-binding universal stress UspA family protein